MKLELLIIDPQNDFCDPKGSLFVLGADNDSKRLSKLINRLVDKIDDIHVTMDSHHLVDCAHPIFWVDSKGNHPNPFTLITHNDVANGVWKPFNPSWQQRMLDYTKSLENNNRYVLCIWPPHCLIGSWGHNIQSEIYSALINWESKRFSMVDYVTKGSNLWTEHYSAVQADVPDPTDPTTMLNTNLIQTLNNADIIGITGQALSHCVKFTIEDIANNFGDENIQKMHLIIDTMSSVPGFEKQGEEFVNNIVARGAKIVKSTEFLK
jgi:nicotinamidase-related amidase